MYRTYITDILKQKIKRRMENYEGTCELINLLLVVSLVSLLPRLDVLQVFLESRPDS